MSNTFTAHTQHVLLRRNTSDAPDNDLENDLLLSNTSTHALQQPIRNRSDSIPCVDHEETVQPTPSHKRKQSDTGDLADLQIQLSPSAFRSSLNLERIEQGDDDDEDDDSIVFSFDNNRSSSQQGRLFSSYPMTKGARLVAAVVVLLVAFMTIRSSRKGRSDDGNMETPSDSKYNDGGNEEIIGEPMEAQIPKYNWIEFYDDVSRIPDVQSSGPFRVDANIGGLHLYENVCVTNNVDAPKAPYFDTSMRGLVYFTNDKAMQKNSKRCVPCKAEDIDERWGSGSSGSGEASNSVKHQCGMKGLHTMYASSVTDWNQCTASNDNHQMMIRTKQNQSPANAKHVHFFEKPTFLLQFQANDRESSLFDTLFTYLPHWHKFREEAFPFQSVISHSVEGCLSHSRNWFCEIAHHLGAFGRAKEIMWEQTESTLYCFQSLYYNQLSYQRTLSHDGLITKSIMDDFRDELFRSFALPRPRDMSEIRKKDAKLGMTRAFKIALYANANGRKDVWKGLESLVSSSQAMTKYHGVEFTLIDNLDNLTVAEQARAFNLADAIIMASGEHLANSIFTTDDTAFVELGCETTSLIDNSHFMGFILGTHTSVGQCQEGHSAEEVCVTCSGIGGLESSFSMTGVAFHELIDDLMKSHQDKVAFMRDSL
ncbi:predicted protein [Thalassiosira pseudonana CCMP1335]|uniref:Uncharacterized protein n=1 Tax=Thalassiosira pseudonana TaxID=35128 RepID=B8C5T9_THAPS|nr:predicted protein [Thalassiosira pseudonana CCMP1335]EED91179.1 predicted protein [Thalassiosira pseudonana CCMP1335]